MTTLTKHPQSYLIFSVMYMVVFLFVLNQLAWIKMLDIFAWLVINVVFFSMAILCLMLGEYQRSKSERNELASSNLKFLCSLEPSIAILLENKKIYTKFKRKEIRLISIIHSERMICLAIAVFVVICPILYGKINVLTITSFELLGIFIFGPNLIYLFLLAFRSIFEWTLIKYLTWLSREDLKWYLDSITKGRKE